MRPKVGVQGSCLSNMSTVMLPGSFGKGMGLDLGPTLKLCLGSKMGVLGNHGGGSKLYISGQSVL